MDRLNLNSATVIAISSLIGCEPKMGLVNRLNDMIRAGKITEDMQYGLIYHRYLTSELERQFLLHFPKPIDDDYEEPDDIGG